MATNSSLSAVAANVSSAGDFMAFLDVLCQSYGDVHGWVSIVICLLGTITNLMNIVVLTRPSILNPVNLLLTSIAVCDMSLMISQFSSVFYSRVLFNLRGMEGCKSPQQWYFGWVLFQNLHMQFSVWAHVTSLWLAVVLGIGRFLTIQSGGVTVWTQIPFVLKTIGVTSLLCAVGSMPVFLYTKIVPVTVELVKGNKDSRSYCASLLCCATGNDTCVNVPKCLQHYDNQIYVLEDTKLLGEKAPEIIMLLAALVHKIAPCVLLTLFMGLLIATMVKAEKRRKRLLGGTHQRVTNCSDNSLDPRTRRSHSRATTSDRTTAMLVTVVFIFVATELPQGVVLLLAAARVDRFELIYYHLGDFFELLSMVNSSVNFVLYCVMSQKFRRVFCDVFCCGKRRRSGEKSQAEPSNTYNGRRDSEHSRSRQASNGALNLCCWESKDEGNQRESLRDTLMKETSETFAKARVSRPLASFDHAKVAKRQSHQSVETEIDSFSCHRLIEV